LNRENRNALRRCERARKSTRTCPASRHVLIMAECLAEKASYAMMTEDPESVAGSLLSVVEALWNARIEIDRLKKKAGEA